MMTKVPSKSEKNNGFYVQALFAAPYVLSSYFRDLSYSGNDVMSASS